MFQFRKLVQSSVILAYLGNAAIYNITFVIGDILNHNLQFNFILSRYY